MTTPAKARPRPLSRTAYKSFIDFHNAASPLFRAPITNAGEQLRVTEFLSNETTTEFLRSNRLVYVLSNGHEWFRHLANDVKKLNTSSLPECAALVKQLIKIIPTLRICLATAQYCSPENDIFTAKKINHEEVDGLAQHIFNSLADSNPIVTLQIMQDFARLCAHDIFVKIIARGLVTKEHVENFGQAVFNSFCDQSYREMICETAAPTPESTHFL